MTTASVSTARKAAVQAVSDDVVRRSARRRRSYVRLVAVFDTTVITLALLGGYLYRFTTAEPREGVPYLPIGIAIASGWLLWLRYARAYDDRVLGYGSDEYRRVAGASMRLAGTVAIVGYIVDIGVSR